MNPRTSLSIRSRIPCIFGLLAAGYLIGRMDDGGRQAHAELRQTPRRQAFEAGDQQSVTVLRDISKTLKTMDARIARIEKTVTTFPIRPIANE